MQQSMECETKAEYDASYHLLITFLDKPKTLDDLGVKCINAIKSLQENLRSKEYKLANHFRMDIRNCMDACTTSPVESANNSLKHGPRKVNSNMNIDRATKQMLNGIDSRLERRRNSANRAMNRSSYASRAPTSNHVIKKGQGLIDREFDLAAFFPFLEDDFFPFLEDDDPPAPFDAFLVLATSTTGLSIFPPPPTLAGTTTCPLGGRLAR